MDQNEDKLPRPMKTLYFIKGPKITPAQLYYQNILYKHLSNLLGRIDKIMDKYLQSPVLKRKFI